jgi:hypothetical protein
MKHLLPKLLFIIFLVLGISSFVFLKDNKRDQKEENTVNARFQKEMTNGFSEREAR